MVREARFAWDGPDGIDFAERRDRFHDLDDPLLDPFPPSTPKPQRRTKRNHPSKETAKREPAGMIEESSNPQQAEHDHRQTGDDWN